MKNGITYYRLKSPYEGDYLKNCGLEGSEIDNNFFVLEGRDVKSIDVIGDDIVLTLINGDTISAEDALKGYTKDLSFSFDEENGVLTITHDGEVTEISGFTAECCPVATDNTLVGDGTKENPLGLASGQQTGHYKPVIGLIDLTEEDGKLPDENLHVGDRYVVKDSIDTNGSLYDFYGVMSICNQLCGSEWRIPTIEDWNNMLNSIEPDDSYKTHSIDNKALWQGKYAGKFLKSMDMQDVENGGLCGWVECEDEPCNGCGDDCTCGDGTTGNVNPCVTHDCGHEQTSGNQVIEPSKSGIDCYDFCVDPIGYAVSTNDDDKIMYGRRSYFWTASKSQTRDVAYVVGFDACKTKVQKDIMPFDNFMSLRLVKDYNGHNFYGQENIQGQTFDTVLMSESNTIWTRSNVSLPVCDCHSTKPKMPEECANELVVYYIVEWDGTNWVYTVVNVGYTVTIVVDGIPTEYIVRINPDTGDAELVKKDDDSQIIADIDDLNERVEKIEEIIGEYDTSKGTISDRLSVIEDRLRKLNFDFSDIDDEPGIDAGDEINVPDEYELPNNRW